MELFASPNFACPLQTTNLAPATTKLEGSIQIMKILKSLAVLLVLVATVSACSDNNSGSGNDLRCSDCNRPPSSAAAAFPGARGRFPLQPGDWIGSPDGGPTTQWLDTDGVAPEIAGGHLGWDLVADEWDGRAFAEVCREDGLLVESNPGVEEIHDHANDTGSPDTFNCKEYCMGIYENATGGSCQPVPQVACPLSTVSLDSAECVCDFNSELTISR